jgi:hypothetical protein
MGGWVGSAPACCGSSLGSNPDISQKYEMGDISKGVDINLYPAKIYTKKEGDMVRWFRMGNGWLTEFQTSHTFLISILVLPAVYCKTLLALHAIPRFGMQIAQKSIW